MRIAKMEALEDYNRRASQNIQSYVLARREAVARAAMKGEAWKIRVKCALDYS
jgi:hypothetical protein